jgi:hypothetical protein
MKKMKKIILVLMATCLSLTLVPVQSFASTTKEPSSLVVTKPVESTESAEAAKAEALILRLDEIKAMDASTMKASEKKELRKEVRSIKRELKDISGGVYISAGALILILILLIIFL